MALQINKKQDMTIGQAIFYILIVCGVLLVISGYEDSGPTSENTESHGEAISSCRSHIKASLTFPSSYKGGALSAGAKTTEDGAIMVLQDFTAKNGLGIELPQTAVCMLKEGQIISMDIRNR